jgi:hypothetical protein
MLVDSLLLAGAFRRRQRDLQQEYVAVGTAFPTFSQKFFIVFLQVANAVCAVEAVLSAAS